MRLRNDDFVGRTRDLENLHDNLQRDGVATIFQSAQVVLHGLGGVGKTWLAIEYAYRYADAYPGGIWWVSANGDPRDGLLRLAGDIQAVKPGILGALTDISASERSARAVQLALQNHPEPSLIILDNITSPEWARYVPGGRTVVLATTRDAALGVGTRQLLEVFTAEEAIELATEVAGVPIDPTECRARERVLVEILGRLAVGVRLAAHAVAGYSMKWSDYEREVRSKADRLLGTETPMAEYPRSVFAAIDLSLEACMRHESAYRVLEGTAVFAPTWVAYAWVGTSAKMDPTTLEFRQAIATLGDLGLAIYDSGRREIFVHPLVHQRIGALLAF